jgi:hypothetical protein
VVTLVALVRRTPLRWAELILRYAIGICREHSDEAHKGLQQKRIVLMGGEFVFL